MTDNPSTPSDSKTAADALNGFHYQLMLSACAWLGLQVGEELLLEVSEDFSVRSRELAESVQVKTSRKQSGPTSYNLRSADIQAALDRLWQRQQADPDRRHRLTFVANGGVHKERKIDLPDGLTGIEYWQRAAINADTAPLRDALASIFDDRPIGRWLKNNPSDEELREQLLRRVHWNLHAGSTEVIDEQLYDQAADLCIQKKLPVRFAAACRAAIRDKIFEVARQRDASQRILTPKQLHELIEEVIERGVSLLRASESAAPDTRPVESILVEKVAAPTGLTVARQDTVDGIIQSTTGERLIWLFGASSVGKSTLAELIARHVGGDWIRLDLRPVHNDASGALTAWRDLQRTVAESDSLRGVIIDDLSSVAVDVVLPRLAVFVAGFSAIGGRVIVTSSREPPPSRVTDLGVSQRSVIQAPYFSISEIQEMLIANQGPGGEALNTWATFIYMATGAGHPLLVAAKVAGLRLRNWPSSALMEDLDGSPSSAIRATREEARLKLLGELTALDSERSIDAGRLLRRIASVFDNVDHDLALQLAKATPTISTGGDGLALLRGTWLEVRSHEDLRVSPLLADIANDVPQEEMQKFRRLAAEYWLSKRELDQRTLPRCFWNALFGKHEWILAKLCQTLETLPQEVLKGAAALLAPMVALKTDRPIFPENAFISGNLRLLQFEVADATQNQKVAEASAAALLREIDAIEPAEIRPALISVAAAKVLMAEHVRASPSTLITLALRADESSPKLVELFGPEVARSRKAIRESVGGADIGAFLYGSSIMRSRSSEEFLSTLKALDTLEPETRNALVDSVRTVLPDSLTIAVASGWANDQLSNRDMAAAAACYEQADTIVSRWDRKDVSSEIACARSVIADEGLSDETSAIQIVDEAIAHFGALPQLVRQKAKVLAHHGRDEEALALSLTIESTVGSTSFLERGLALRDAAVSAARLKQFDVAARLFGAAREAITKLGEHEPLAAGLRAERAMALWDSGDRKEGLAELVAVFLDIEKFEPALSRQAQRAHQFARGMAGLFFHDLENANEPRPKIAYSGASALSTKNEPLAELDLKPLSHNWEILGLVEQSLGVDLGVEALSAARRSGDGIPSLRALRSQIAYRKALERRNLEELLSAGVIASSAVIRLAKGEGRSEGNPEGPQPQAEGSNHPLAAQMLLQIPVDAALFHKLMGGEVDDAFLDGIRRAIAKTLPDDSNLRLVAESLATAFKGELVLPQQFTARAVAASDEAIRADPELLYRWSLLVFEHLLQSLARSSLEPIVTRLFQEGWRRVLAQQRFLLQPPTRQFALIEAAVNLIETDRVRGMAELLLAAAPSVGFSLSANRELFLRKLARPAASSAKDE